MPPQLTSIESFAGIGGFSSPAITPIALIEKEPTCRAVLRRHHPHALILEDVRDAGAHNLPWANIHKFGFPCQDLSVAGKRAGLAGGRSGLFFEAARITYELQPDYAIWENVPGLRTSCSCRRCRRHCGACGEIAGADEAECLVCGSDELRGRVLRSHRGADFFTVVSTLGYIGFDGAWTLLDAQYFGVAQRRQRLFGVFARRDIGAERCTKILSLATRMSWNPAASKETRPNIAATIRAGSSGGNNGGFRTEPAEHLIAVSFAQNQRGELRTSTISPQLTTGGGKPGEGYAAVLTFTERTRNGERNLEVQENLAYTLTNPGKGGRTQERNIAGDFGVRRLTPIECERLQGFEDDYTAWGVDDQGQRIEMSDSVRYRMCGNAVCKNVSAWLDQQIIHFGYE
jgi:DNA (cytosine-5)-methyltransferase 1